jgi:hypothetical protein
MIQHKHITVVSKLTATAGRAEKWFEPHGCLQTVIDTPAPGFILQILLGAEGLQIRHSDRMVVIPRDVLLALGEALDPGLTPPAAAEVAKLAEDNSKLLPPGAA